jgi:hypothetical protein
MEPDWFAMPTPPRTSRSSCSRTKPPLLTRVCCKNTVGTPTYPPAGPPRLVASPVRHFYPAPASMTPSLHARGRLPCIRTRLRNRAEPATGRTLLLVLADTPVQFRSDLRVLQLRRPFHLLRHHQDRSTTAAGLALRVEPALRCFCPDRLAAAQLLLPPPRGPRPARTRAAPSAVVRTRPPPFFMSSSQCCLTLSAAFSSMVSDVLHARLHCFPRAGPRREP